MIVRGIYKIFNPKLNIFHLRSNFYAGEFFNPLPTISKYCKPMLGLYETIESSLIAVAFQPEGTVPDTHYKVLQVVAQALTRRLNFFLLFVVFFSVFFFCVCLLFLCLCLLLLIFSESEAKKDAVKDDDTAVNTQSNVQENNLKEYDTISTIQRLTCKKMDVICDKMVRNYQRLNGMNYLISVKQCLTHCFSTLRQFQIIGSLLLVNNIVRYYLNFSWLSNANSFNE